MLNELLEFPQRIIAFARIGLRPSADDIEAALQRIDQAQSEMRLSRHLPTGLEPARSALVLLRLGHMPNKDACTRAVVALGHVMAMGEDTQAA